MKEPMSCIKSIHIEGFKKFKFVDVSLNPHMNILVGENEAGKSTILEAIRIVLNQQYRNADKSVLSDLFGMKSPKGISKVAPLVFEKLQMPSLLNFPS